MRTPLVALVALVATGCVDPGKDFDAFRARLPTTTVADAGGTPGDAGACAVKPGGIQGQFLFALSASVKPNTPIVSLVDVTTPAFAGGTGITLGVQPLSAKDRRTPAGPSFTFGPFAVDAQGQFKADIKGLNVTGVANPVTPGADIAADVVLAGNLCGDGRFFCGTVTGQTTKPLPLDLSGSTFTLTLVDPGSTLPTQPKLDCAGTLADPL
jgi:hypothetical protein